MTHRRSKRRSPDRTLVVMAAGCVTPRTDTVEAGPAAVAGEDGGAGRAGLDGSGAGGSGMSPGVRTDAGAGPGPVIGDAGSAGRGVPGPGAGGQGGAPSTPPRDAAAGGQGGTSPPPAPDAAPTGPEVAAPVCGDGTVNGVEQCDLGEGRNTGAYGGCNGNCTRAPRCGDGVLNGPEACDVGEAGNVGGYGSPCNPDCTLPPRCGDGTLNGPESCDSGDDNGLEQGACNPACSGLVASKRIRMTMLGVPGNLGGVAGADAMCVASFGAGYKAMLVDGERRIAAINALGVAGGQVDWVLRPYTRYLNANNALVWTTRAVPLLTVDEQGRQQPLLAPIDVTPFNGYNVAWGGMRNDWRVSDSGTCNGWTSGSIDLRTETIIATSLRPDQVPSNNGTSSCDFPRYVICVQQ